MLQLLVLSRLIMRRIPGGKALEVFSRSKMFIEDTVVGMRPPHIQREIEKAEEDQLWDVLFPVQISDKTFREEGACRYLEQGLGRSIESEYVFTLREWREVMEWFEVLAHNNTLRAGRKERINGEGRLLKGRRRWETPTIQAAARGNAAEHTSIWLGHGMWPE